MVRQVETLNKYEKGNFFSSKSVSRAGAELCSHAEQHRVTFDELEMPFGPGIQFDMEGLVWTVLKRYGLYEIAKTQGGLELAFTVDGANITKKRCILQADSNYLLQGHKIQKQGSQCLSVLTATALLKYRFATMALF